MRAINSQVTTHARAGTARAAERTSLARADARWLREGGRRWAAVELWDYLLLENSAQHVIRIPDPSFPSFLPSPSPKCLPLLLHPHAFLEPGDRWAAGLAPRRLKQLHNAWWWHDGLSRMSCVTNHRTGGFIHAPLFFFSSLHHARKKMIRKKRLVIRSWTPATWTSSDEQPIYQGRQQAVKRKSCGLQFPHHVPETLQPLNFHEAGMLFHLRHCNNKWINYMTEITVKMYVRNNRK